MKLRRKLRRSLKKDCWNINKFFEIDFVRKLNAISERRFDCRNGRFQVPQKNKMTCINIWLKKLKYVYGTIGDKS